MFIINKKKDVKAKKNQTSSSLAYYFVRSFLSKLFYYLRLLNLTGEEEDPHYHNHNCFLIAETGVLDIKAV